MTTITPSPLEKDRHVQIHECEEHVGRAVAVVHQNHCVIGDVNHGSITVAQNTTLKLIDFDKLSDCVNGYTYLCEVGVPTFTPPQLQERPFHGIVRTANHDASNSAF